MKFLLFACVMLCPMLHGAEMMSGINRAIYLSSLATNEDLGLLPQLPKGRKANTITILKRMLNKQANPNEETNIDRDIYLYGFINAERSRSQILQAKLETGTPSGLLCSLIKEEYVFIQPFMMSPDQQKTASLHILLQSNSSVPHNSKNKYISEEDENTLQSFLVANESLEG